MATHACSAGDLRVLVVDEDCDTLELDELLFRSGGADVRVARNGAAALRLASGWPPTALVTELYLNDMTAFRLAAAMRAMRTEQPPLRVIAVTSRARVQDRVRASEAGFDVFLAKPVDLDRLLRAVIVVPPLLRLARAAI
jgi:CheY-like chemotaxis protein